MAALSMSVSAVDWMREMGIMAGSEQRLRCGGAGRSRAVLDQVAMSLCPYQSLRFTFRQDRFTGFHDGEGHGFVCDLNLVGR